MKIKDIKSLSFEELCACPFCGKEFTASDEYQKSSFKGNTCSIRRYKKRNKKPAWIICSSFGRQVTFFEKECYTIIDGKPDTFSDDMDCSMIEKLLLL